MTNEKCGAYQVGQMVNYKGDRVIVLAKQKGGKTTNINTQGGIITGFKSRPCTYSLSNGLIVRGDKLKKINGGGEQ
jgi:hypothetical protein